jgi:hypothetical protein
MFRRDIKNEIAKKIEKSPNTFGSFGEYIQMGGMR